jgi:hypothetical protein
MFVLCLWFLETKETASSEMNLPSPTPHRHVYTGLFLLISGNQRGFMILRPAAYTGYILSQTRELPNVASVDFKYASFCGMNLFIT